MRRQSLGKKTYLVLLASAKGDAYVEVVAYTADAAKQHANRMYSAMGWCVMSAKAKREKR